MQLFTALLSVLAIVSSATALPNAHAARESKPVGKGPGPVVIFPGWVNPKNGTVWKIGSEQLVQWNTTFTPPSITAETANLMLGFYDSNQNGSAVVYSKPLVKNITVGNDTTSIIVPNVTSGNEYFVALLGPQLWGDFGAVSLTFSITN